MRAKIGSVSNNTLASDTRWKANRPPDRAARNAWSSGYAIVVVRPIVTRSGVSLRRYRGQVDVGMRVVVATRTTPIQQQTHY